jgi:hypothetical protein
MNNLKRAQSLQLVKVSSYDKITQRYEVNDRTFVWLDDGTWRELVGNRRRPATREMMLAVVGEALEAHDEREAARAEDVEYAEWLAHDLENAWRGTDGTL